ncbi:dynamin family protein [Alkalihalophilus sp. As8PL]|uniref:Dynamin family protein n=1 Tax=Alkalihalophilus sp. As8PL TaxID=3237103 RepID=A0AB39BUG0_9BACI
MKVDVKQPVFTETEALRQKMIREKEMDDRFEVAFCGHFSAGKSTILNKLLGAEVLPTSPIPTSANIIGIKNGELGLHVERIDETEKEWNGEIPWERVREWGMNGSDISKMTIYAPLPFMHPSSVVYDTPGVDSTDPTHQAVTMEALYTTDLIVYVMDYNHIQSETNLYFLKQLSDENKPLYIVINQVDKHDEDELSFESFKQSVLDGFNEWGICPLDLYFTSMKVHQHPLNQFDAFKQRIKSILHYSHELMMTSKKRLNESFYLSVAQRLEEEKQDEIEEVLDTLSENGFNKEDLKQKEKAQKELVEIERLEQSIHESFDDNWNHLTKDVTIFPYETTELTREWLDSMQPNFRVGLLFTKKKTEEEREMRLKKLIASTQDKLKSQLEFHIHRLFEKYDRTHLSNREEFEQAISQLHVEVKRDDFVKAVTASHFDRDYVFTFTKDRTAYFIKELRKQAEGVVDLYIMGLSKHVETKKKSLSNQLKRYKEIEVYTLKIEEIKENYNNEKENIHQIAADFNDKGRFETQLDGMANREVPGDVDQSVFSQVELPKESVIETTWEEEKESKRDLFNDKEAKDWLDQLVNIMNTNQTPMSLDHEKHKLIDRINRYNDRSFIISLFGAFSAGKSSFANALLGDSILPVSPHPTTATVTTVKRSDDAHPHLSARVELKSREQLDQEIKSVAKQLDENITITDLKKWSPKDTLQATSWQRTYVSYLLTLKESLKTTEWELGEELSVNHETLAQYVADEQYACLIDHVTIYFDCPLTLEGIVLVDTPGVNSIHGRHTNVAFTQLRESDAIFYVTYYNHAFSKSDQHFLTQMAKVNDRFTHDKLYFILNAADLASSPAELNGVKKHINDQLLNIGIEKPRLYPLSSKKGLAAKQSETKHDQMFSRFEDAFYTETVQELKQLSFSLIQEEVKTYLNQLQEAIDFVDAKEDVRKKKQAQRKEQVDKWKNHILEVEPVSAKRRTAQEINELFLYLRERVQYVLNDQYTDAINVTTVTGKTKKVQQQTFVAAIKEWRNSGEYFLSQELEATILRVETSMKQSLVSWMREMEESIRGDFQSFLLDLEELNVSFNHERQHHIFTLDPTSYLSFLSTLKSFFEEGGTRQLKNQLVNDGTTLAKDYLLKLEAEINRESALIFDDVESEMKQQIVKGLDREFERLTMIMTDDEKEAIEKEFKSLKAFIQ